MKKKLVFAVLAGFLGIASITAAQEATPAVSPEKRKPIIVKYTTINGINFYYSGLKLKSNNDLRKVMGPQTDPELNRLLKLSDDDFSSGTAFLIAGTPVLAGGIVFAVVSYNGGNNIDRTGQAVGWSGALVGLVVDYIGIFKFFEAHTSRYAAVERYNAILHGDDLEPLTLQQRGIQADLLAFDF